MSQYVNKNCPICGGYVYLNTIGTEICQSCGYTLPFTTNSYSNKSTSSADKYCQNCNTKMVPLGDGGWWDCPQCGYGYMDYIGDLPDDITDMSKKIFEGKMHIPCDNVWGVGKIAIAENMSPQTLTITNCEKIKLKHKEMDIDFEFDTSKLENIDTIIINGHKYVKEK